MPVAGRVDQGPLVGFPARGEEEVPGQSERGSCFHVGAVLSLDADDALELVPSQSSQLTPVRCRSVLAKRQRPTNI
jgi:hypothetical protein